MSLAISQALGNLPTGLRDELLAEFDKISRNYRERRWEAAELDGGRLSEVVYTILDGFLKGGAYAASASKPSNFKVACEQLAQADKAIYPKSARLTLPLMLVSLYDLRNNRGVGHVGGDVSANHMDATIVLHASQWVMAELVRIFHGISIDDATKIVDALVDRTTPMIWKVGDVVRILDTGLTLDEGTLLLLYSDAQGVHEKKLMESLEQKDLSNYRRVLRRLHQKRAVEYNETTRLSVISPVGIKDVEERLLRR